MQKLYGILSLLMVCGSVDAMEPKRKRSKSPEVGKKRDPQLNTVLEEQLEFLLDMERRKRLKKGEENSFSDCSGLKEDIDLLPPTSKVFPEKNSNICKKF